MKTSGANEMWQQFHTLWGMAHDLDYQKAEWERLKELLEQVQVEIRAKALSDAVAAIRECPRYQGEYWLPEAILALTPPKD